ncbi:MAG: hypothetical protein RW306_01205 [Geobacteraceae bacterium]|nr:hypothetical protein [Geobacteraceae bacterium]
MKNRRLGSIVLVSIIAGLLSLAGTLALAAPMKPELAAKKENYRRQKEQQITPEKRKIAAEALKAERIKVYNAKQAAKQSTPATINTK